MTIDAAVSNLLTYGLEQHLLDPLDYHWTKNRLLELLKLPDVEEPASHQPLPTLPEILDTITAYGAEHGFLVQDSPTGRDLFDTQVMGVITPPPSTVITLFHRLKSRSPEEATSWFYQFCQDCNYIRTDRIQRDIKWTVESRYGQMDITINLSKPEKDPKAIAAARDLPASAYPACQLCRENEGYAGRLDHPARQNLRMIPLSLCGEEWFLQFSPYVYYNEHCIVLNRTHQPMRIDRATFSKLLDFVGQFPHYFVGSNADLPIVGGSILSHEHFQGGHYTFAMEKAPIEREYHFSGFPQVRVGLVHWPMSVLRLQGEDPEQLTQLGGQILDSWRGYSDPQLEILSHSGETPHNTITPIARTREGKLELDLVLRNNRTSPEHPLGIFHPHGQLHHIKRENIGLIEVMGLAVLPARLREELETLQERILAGLPLLEDTRTAKHQEWARSVLERHPEFSRENAGAILRQEVGKVFVQVLEHAGVFKWNSQGLEGFDRFVKNAGGM